MEQTVAYQRPGMVGTVGAGELPLNPSVHTRPLVRPHIRYVGAFTPHDETIPVNVGCPVPASRKVATKPTRYVLKPRHSARPGARGRQGGYHTGSGELHATFFDSPSNGSHALPPTAQVVAPPMEQSVAYRRHGKAGAVGAGELPPDAQCPHLAARSPTHQARGGIHAPDETIPLNTDFPAPAQRKAAT